MKIVFLNGPPGCGKDTAAEALFKQMPCQLLKFAAPIKRMVCGALGETLEWLEKNKDRPDPRLNGETPRQFLIALSEDLIKPRYGDRFFGNCMVGELDKRDASGGIVLITDSGFMSEAIPVVTGYGITNCLKVEIYREGTDFMKDSRSYWQMPGLRTVKLFNDGTIDQLPDKLFGILSNVWGCVR
jgi:hypothetical protein